VPAGNLSAAIPVQAQGYRYHLPENYAGYEQYYLSYNYYPYPYPYFAYVVPIGFAFRFGFFHRHDSPAGCVFAHGLITKGRRFDTSVRLFSVVPRGVNRFAVK
jgi:hypothetical protein